MTTKKSDPTVAKPAQELTSHEQAVPRLTLDYPDQTIGIAY